MLPQGGCGVRRFVLVAHGKSNTPFAEQPLEKRRGVASNRSRWLYLRLPCVWANLSGASLLCSISAMRKGEVRRIIDGTVELMRSY